MFILLVPPIDIAAPCAAADRHRHIPYGKARKKQMAGYAFRHYGVRTWKLADPKVVVLHYTVSNTACRPGTCSRATPRRPGHPDPRPSARGHPLHRGQGRDDPAIGTADHDKAVTRSASTTARSASSSSRCRRRTTSSTARSSARRACAGALAAGGVGDRDVQRRGPKMVNASPYFQELVKGLEERSHRLERASGPGLPGQTLGATPAAP